MHKLLLLMTGFLAFITGSTAAAQDQANALDGKSLYDFSFRSIDGEDLPLSTFKGKALLVVNTASRCGFTKQYEGLQSLYEDYQDRGLVVLGVPSNDFMGQEPGSNEDIKAFCETTFGITFPMTEKVSVKGKDAHPFYLWASAQEKGGAPAWNFHKYLFSPDGVLVSSYGSRTAPDDRGFVAAIDAALPRPE